MTADLLIDNATIITMDADRRVLEDASVAIAGNRIIEVGPAAEIGLRHADAKIIAGRNTLVLPGLVDLHGYLGGSILKSIGEGLGGAERRNLMENVLSHEIDEEWWEIEADLSALERLKFGTTFMFSMLGGNGTRTDEPQYARIAARELSRIGLRARLGLGPARPPWPRSYSTWSGNIKTSSLVNFNTVIDHCDALLTEHGKTPGALVDYCTALSRIGNRNEHDPVWSPEREEWVFKQAEAIRYLMDKHGVGFWTHMYGNAVDYTYDEKLGLLGPKTILSHCTDLPERSIGIIRETGSSVAHHPRAARIYNYPGRCPLPELIDAGVVVGLGADVPSNHDCDIFLDMKAAVSLQRVHFRDASLIPAGKALEMATIDGFRALGLAHELGSIEAGKKADLITIDMHQPHLYPFDMPIHRAVYQASGRDVRDVIVDGHVVMRDRKVLTIDEAAVLDRAQAMYRRVIARAGLAAYTQSGARFWGVSR